MTSINQERYDVASKTGNLLAEKNTEISELRAALAAAQNDLHQMTHNAVGAEMERDELREALTAAQEEAQKTRELLDEKIESIAEMEIERGKLREALREIASDKYVCVECTASMTARAALEA